MFAELKNIVVCVQYLGTLFMLIHSKFRQCLARVIEAWPSSQIGETAK